jgi:hypothetical protein
MKMKIEVGKCYRTRNGRKVKVLSEDGSELPFKVDHGGYRLWHYPYGCSNLPGDSHDIVAEWVDDTPKRWRDMTPEEKGALLLAHHEGKVIEYLHECSGGWRDRTGVSKEWHDKTSYRIRPEPVRETVTIEFDEDGNIDTKGVCDLRNVRITVDLIDRNPVPASVKLDEI